MKVVQFSRREDGTENVKPWRAVGPTRTDRWVIQSLILEVLQSSRQGQIDGRIVSKG